jgi:DNA-binding FadR family transcriptional regulator
MILSGKYSAGEKLPTERELAEQLHISRPSVRAALSKLESKGLIIRVQGGGTYVSDKVEASFMDPLLELFQENQDFKYDILEYRHALDEACCYLAATRATDEEKQTIKQKYDAWVTLQEAFDDPEAEAEADLAFHLSIADATHNVILPYAMHTSLKLLKHSVTINLRTIYTSRDGQKLLFDQHTAMLNAILVGDGDAARDAARVHLNSVQSEMEKADIQHQRDSRAKLNKKTFQIG